MDFNENSSCNLHDEAAVGNLCNVSAGVYARQHPATSAFERDHCLNALHCCALHSTAQPKLLNISDEVSVSQHLWSCMCQRSWAYACQQVIVYLVDKVDKAVTIVALPAISVQGPWTHGWFQIPLTRDACQKPSPSPTHDQAKKDPSHGHCNTDDHTV